MSDFVNDVFVYGRLLSVVALLRLPAVRHCCFDDGVSEHCAEIGNQTVIWNIYIQHFLPRKRLLDCPVSFFFLELPPVIRRGGWAPLQ